ncbi:MAG TPA: PIN domain-containing protein [Verrucomicrobiae bacterium]|jgi:predicted nucleic acid-binding protein|nr:PIN domain-containing protein [Verrucomicrobiae bacterium]
MAASEKTLVDTGPLVALLVAKDEMHPWALRVWDELRPPLVTCQAVLSEAQFLIARFGGNATAVLEFVSRGAIHVEFDLESNVKRLLELQKSYRSLPMSLADACLVCMAEQSPRCRIVTTDSHFRVYRRHGRQLISVLMPEEK